jgi:hypothetical protein
MAVGAVSCELISLGPPKPDLHGRYKADLQGRYREIAEISEDGSNQILKSRPDFGSFEGVSLSPITGNLCVMRRDPVVPEQARSSRLDEAPKIGGISWSTLPGCEQMRTTRWKTALRRNQR